MTLNVFKKQLLETQARLALSPRALQLASSVFGYTGRDGIVKAPVNLAAISAIFNDDALADSKIGYQAALLESVVGQVDPLIDLAFEVQSNRASENHIALGDLPPLEEWANGNDRIMSNLSVAATIAIINKKWQATLRVKNDDFRDDALGLLPPHIAGMGQQAALQPGQLVAKMLCNGFDGSDASLGDGLAFDGAFFFDTGHVTGSNKLALAFSVDALNTAATMLYAQKRFDGGELYARGTHLIVGPDNEQAADKVLTANYLANTAGTATESNVLKSKYTLVVSPIIPTGMWFLADLSNPVKPMLFQNREGIKVDIVGGMNGTDFVSFSYDECWIGAYARNNAGYWDFRRIVGSTGS